jgi:hypothetical protein
MIYLNSERLKNILDTMQRKSIVKRGEIHPTTGLPVTGKLTLRQRFVRLALRRASKQAHVVHKYPGK